MQKGRGDCIPETAQDSVRDCVIIHIQPEIISPVSQKRLRSDFAQNLEAIQTLTQCADHARIGRLAEIRIQSFRGQFCGSIFPGESRK